MKISFKIDYRGFKKGQEFEFSDDQATVLVGNNGCGKSTLAWLVSETTGPSRVGSREKALDIANVDVGDKKFHSFNSDLGNLRHLSYFSEDTLLQVQAMHVSKGEAILLQLAKFIGDTRGTGNWVVLDEPDSGIAPYQAELLRGILSPRSQMIAVFHNPILIESFPKVHDLQRDSDGLVTMVKTSGEAYLRQERERAKKVRELWRV